MNVKVTTLCSL